LTQIQVETKPNVKSKRGGKRRLSDLGRCLINGQSAGDQIPDEPMRVPDKGDEVKDPSVAESEGEADAAKG